MRNKNRLIALFIVLIVALGGYFFWRNGLSQKPTTVNPEQARETSVNQAGNAAIQNNQASVQADTNPAPVQKPDSSVLASNNNPVKWQTYINKRLGISFQYPAAWAKIGGDADVINLAGVKTEVDINFTDTASKTSLLIACHLAPEGAKLYDYVSNQYHTSQGRFAMGGTQIQVGGKNAFESSTILSLDGRGRKLNPALRSVIVDVQDYNLTGAIEFQFKTPVINDGMEVKQFHQLLSGFKFLTK